MASSDVRNASTNFGLYNAIIFDLGDVLFTWSSSPKSPLPANLFRRILSSSHWFEYEKGNLDEAQVYSLVAKQFAVEPAAVKNTCQISRDSLQSNEKILEVIRELKETGLSIYAMSNISAPDWEILRVKATPEEWALFDDIFTSYVSHLTYLMSDASLLMVYFQVLLLVSASQTLVSLNTLLRRVVSILPAPYL